ncbi:hypothetical protein [Guptibacillus spartinae]|uniref:hypothetical protein n=1 Tax=Guptibacillus spartinae TaxID=3025679 RepID=UPI002361E5DA|nr:hypothetical protein [Pseudalkalibacillus spartinae]
MNLLLKRGLLSIAFLVLAVSTLVNPSYSSAATKLDSKESFEVPDIKFTPKVINTYKDENGHIINEYSKLPDNFVTDENGNIISEESQSKTTLRKENKVTTAACSYQYYYDVVGRVTVERDAFVNYHPAFPQAQKNVSEYNFTFSTTSYSIGVSGYGMSADVSISAPGAGYSISANPTMWTRPAVYGDIERQTVKVTRTGGCTSGEKITYQTRYVPINTYIDTNEWSYNPN